MELTIVNPHPKYPRVGLIEPPPTGYLHLAAMVEPTAGRTPFPRRSPRKAALLAELKALAAGLQRLDAVSKATVYRAVLVPPAGSDAQRMASHPARYDVAVLVETATVDAAAEVEATPEYRKLRDAVTSAARDSHVMTARCLRRVGDVDKTRQGLFLFNYFVAEDPAVALDLWDYLAAWYATETGMDNSTLLGPVGAADYVFVNHARWDMSLPRFAAEQFGKPSFYRFVIANLHANAVAAMPILYRLAM
ncbi:MAG TPA: hypothetical protein VKV35_08025 [Streptosporangiaceae bacterium]|nr:hypothetical protein [Streptosporangiaceae bacterium]